MKRVVLAVVFLSAWSMALRAQNIVQIAQSDPLAISGAVGTQNTFHYSSGTSYATPLSNTIYANLNVSIYGISFPFALYYSNNSFDFSYPRLSFSLSPTYKSWTGHFGESTMPFSNYVMNMSFMGVGLEYNDGKRWRAGAFYGRLQKAISDDTQGSSPQYKRMGWGFKFGYGSGKNYIDLYFLNAYDVINSLDETWRTKVTPKQNVVVGVKGCVTPFKWMNFTANVAASVFNTDATAEKVAVRNDFDKIFDVRYSTLARFAGDLNMNLSFKNFNTSISYRMIQPDYTSLGTYYMNNNYHSLGITASTTLFKRLALSATFNGQADNLTKKQLYTTMGYIYAANASMPIAKNLSLTLGYNGYLQDQGNGTAIVTDSSRVHRMMNSATGSLSYAIDGTTLGHNFSVSGNWVGNKDLNKFATGKSDVSTWAVGANYGMDIKAWELNLNATYSHQQTNGYDTRYSSDVLGITAGRSFLEEKNLNLSATLNWIYNEVKHQSKSLSIGGSFNIGYTLKKYHSFSASASFNKYGDVNVTKTRSSLDMTDISASLNYVYTFSVVVIKSKKHKEEDRQKKEAQMQREINESLNKRTKNL